MFDREAFKGHFVTNMEQQDTNKLCIFCAREYAQKRKLCTYSTYEKDLHFTEM